MYVIPDKNVLTIDDFILPFGGKLSADNRWVKKANEIPWDILEKKYAELFKHKGAPAKTFRMAFGSLYIKYYYGTSDEETIQNIIENPYLQYFIGLKEFHMKKPFDSTTMVHFRKRLPLKELAEINEFIINYKNDQHDEEDKNNHNGISQKEMKTQENKKDYENKGTMIIDATCVPSDIQYPTDINLLNEAREKLEEMIDILFEPYVGIEIKPRTYRKRARKEYLQIIKKKIKNKKEIRKVIRKQLNYVQRDLDIIEKLSKDINIEEVFTKKQIEH